uniref:ShKT domain-containing protein n=1 Tax=Meloidogyne hapla TaxID=6305 RepID=A0A1I8BWV5_MELHA
MVDVIKLLQNTQDPYKVFHLKKGESFTHEDLNNNYETIKQLIETSENEDKDEALKKLDEFHDQLAEKAVEKENGPGDAEPDEEASETHVGPEQNSEEKTETKETKEEGEDGPKENANEENDEEGPKHEESEEKTKTKETEEETEPKVEGEKKDKKDKKGKTEKKEKKDKAEKKVEKKEATKEKVGEKEKLPISQSNSIDSSSSSEEPLEEGPEILKAPPPGSEELPSERIIHWPESDAIGNKRRRERKEEKEREKEREEEKHRSRQEQIDEISDESGPNLAEEIKSSESSEEDEYERRKSKERGEILPGDTAINCKRYIHRCYIEEYMNEMNTYCRGTCDQLGVLNIDIGLNCEELAFTGLCSDETWGDKMDKYCHKSCTSLRGKR